MYSEANEYIRQVFLHVISYPPNVWAIKIVEFPYKQHGKTVLGLSQLHELILSWGSDGSINQKAQKPIMKLYR